MHLMARISRCVDGHRMTIYDNLFVFNSDDYISFRKEDVKSLLYRDTTLPGG